MANEEQLSILKRGVEAWNGWRAKNIYAYADLNEADLNGADLSQADLRIAHLRRANLFRADLSGANLSGADLSDANLREANLSEAGLTQANLNGASLSGAFVRAANLSQANLLAANLKNSNLSHATIRDGKLMFANFAGADLSEADLGKADLTKAYLSGARLRRADVSGARLTRANLAQSDLVEARFIRVDLTKADLSEAKLGGTVFADSNLSGALGLENLDHRGPSHISMDILVLSAGNLPSVFLRGCGFSDSDLEYAKLSSPHLDQDEIAKILSRVQELRATQGLQTAPLFISYSSSDSVFVNKLESRLTEKGIRVWRDVHQENAGEIENQIYRNSDHNPKVLLILSEHSIKTRWLEGGLTEMRTLENEMGHKVLYPVALDDGWKFGRGPKRLMEQMTEYDVLDLSSWRNNSKFEVMFRELIDKLELFDQR